jgi:hypothetical protein
MAIGDFLSDTFDNLLNPGVRPGSRGDLALQARASEEKQTDNNRLATTEMNFQNKITEIDNKINANIINWDETGFTDANDYNNWKTEWNTRQKEIAPNDYLKVYGKEGGIDKLNYLGFGPAVLGLGKELDPLNSYFTEDGQFVPYVRTADQARGQVYSAPFTVDGQRFRDVAQEFEKQGEGEVPYQTIDLKALAPVYRNFKTDVYKVPQLAALGTAMTGAQPNIRYFTEDARGDINTFISQLSPDEVVSDTSGVTPETGVDVPDAGERDVLALTNVEDATRFIANATKVKTRGKDDYRVVLQEDVLNSFGMQNYLTNPNTNPFNMPDEEFNQLSLDQQRKLLSLDKRVSDNNVREYFKKRDLGGILEGMPTNFEKDFKDATSILPRVPGKAEEAKNVPAVKAFLEDNQEKLITEVFPQDPALFEEFKANPYEFGKKYRNNENALFGGPISPSDKKAIAGVAPEGVKGITVADTKKITDAINDNDPKAFQAAMNELVGDNRLTEEQQETLVGILQKNNNNFQRLDTSNRAQLAGSILASVDNNAYIPYLMRFMETGQLSFEDDTLRLNQRKQLIDEANLEKEGPISGDANALFKELTNKKRANESILEYGPDVASIIDRAYGTGNAADVANAQNVTKIYLKDYVQSKANQGFWENNFLTSWLFRDVSPTQLEMSPDVVAIDRQGSPVTDPTKANQVSGFIKKGPQGELEGKKFSRSEVERDLGKDATDMLFFLSLDYQGG